MTSRGARLKLTLAYILGACCVWALGCNPGDSAGRQDAALDGGTLSDGSVRSDASVDDASLQHGPVMLHGAAEKGPLVIGSSLSVSAVTNAGVTTGLVFNAETTDNLGHFELSVTYRGAAALEANGYYYNEATGGLSTAQLTLRGWYEVSDQSEQTANLNVITHLANRRVLKLVQGGATFAQAQAQADSELLSQLGIAAPASIDGHTASILSSAYLFAVSAVIAEAGGADAALQELLNQLALDLEDDGALTTAHYQQLRSAQDSLDPKAVMDHLAARMKELGLAGGPPDLNTVLDSDLDGLLNDHDNCPNVANVDQADFDMDGVGNVCCVVASICTNGGSCATGPDNAGYSCTCFGDVAVNIDGNVFISGESVAASLAPCSAIDGSFFVASADVNLPLLETVSKGVTVAVSAANLSLPKLSSIGGLFEMSKMPTTPPSLPELVSTGGMILGATGTLSLPKLQTIHADFTPQGMTLDAPLLSKVEGSLVVGDILQSISLPALASIGGNLEAGGLQLTSVSLPALESVGSNVSLGGANVASVDLHLLATVGQTLQLQSLPGLVSINFPALTTVKGVIIQYVDAAVGLPALASTGAFSLHDSSPPSFSLPALTSVSVLEIWNTGLTSVAIPTLTTITQDLVLESNTSLTSASFVGLTSIAHNLAVDANSVLTTLDLPALTTVGAQFKVTDNKQLPTSQANALHDQLTSAPGSTIISGNKP